MSDVWDISVEAEENIYNWKDKPLIQEAKKNTHGDYVHLDLFSGCGGFSEGFNQAGFTTNLAIDIHPPSLKTLQFNHPEATAVCGDIRKIFSDLFLDFLPKSKNPIVITAGVPCQGFSLSNRKRHADDKRNFLFKEFIRITKDINPDAVVLENVSGLVSAGGGTFKKDISKAIEELGYHVNFSILDAADYGVPQRRRRIFFVGVKKNSNWLFPKKTHGVSLKTYNTVKDAILGDLPTLKAKQSSDKYTREPISEYELYLRERSKKLTSHQAPNHPDETILKISNTKPGKPMYPKFKQRIRLRSSDLSPTQICGGIRPQFQFGHPTQARGLTIRERARIQSFPDKYYFFGGIVQGRVQTGNAVPPLVAKALAEQIIKHLNGKRLIGIEPEAPQMELAI
jgi:DNA (cytosine-5)-methyltransferase 1